MLVLAQHVGVFVLGGTCVVGCKQGIRGCMRVLTRLTRLHIVTWQQGCMSWWWCGHNRVTCCGDMVVTVRVW